MRRRPKRIHKDEAISLKLSLRKGDTRDDGFRFMYYTKLEGYPIREVWMSPSSWEYRKKQRQKRAEEVRNKKKAFIKRVKLYYGCILCGYNKHPDALHFDHINIHNKLKDISAMVSFSKEKIKLEMKKCRILCANCHAAHTANQREEGVFNENK